MKGARLNAVREMREAREREACGRRAQNMRCAKCAKRGSERRAVGARKICGARKGRRKRALAP